MNKEQLEKIYELIEEIYKLIREDEADCLDVKGLVEELEVAVRNKLKDALWREYMARRT
jgi:hypothetical protein